MTIKDLSQVRYLNSEIANDKRRLYDLELKARNANSSLSAAPGGGGQTSDKVGLYASQIADLRSVIIANEKRCLEEKTRLMRVINEIPDSFLRNVLKLRFIDGYTWRAVAYRAGGRNNSDSIRKMVERYIKDLP